MSLGVWAQTVSTPATTAAVTWPTMVEAAAAAAVAIAAIVALVFNILLVRRTSDYVGVTRDMATATRDAATATRDAAEASRDEAAATARAAVATEEQLNLLRLQHEQSRQVQEREAAPSLIVAGSTVHGEDMPNRPADIYQIHNGGPGSALRVHLLARGRFGLAHPIRSGETVDIRTNLTPPSVMGIEFGQVEMFCQDVLGNYHRFSGELHEVWHSGDAAPIWAELARI